MFGNSLENLGKSTGECNRQTFQQVSEIFENPRKSSEKIGKCRKVLQDDLPAFKKKSIESLRKSSDVFGCIWESSGKFRKFVLKCLKYNLPSIFEIFLKSSEIVGSLRKSSEVFAKDRKMSESSQNNIPTLFENFRKFSEIFGSVRKCSENFGNPRKLFRM